MPQTSIQAGTSFFCRKRIHSILMGIFLLSSALRGHAQTIYRPAGEVAMAEKDFARKAIETGTRQAFLQYYDDGVIVFRAGKAVNGIEEWHNRQADSSELWWQPAFADIAASGDFGYTTGPWEWKKAKHDDKPAAYGYYNSVWKKGNDGVWKVLIDIGVPTPAPSSEKNKNTAFSNIGGKRVKKDLVALEEELLNVENSFILAYQDDVHHAYAKNISAEARLYRPYHMPYATADSVRAALADTSIRFSFELVDGQIASSGDLGYVYGNVKAKGVFNDKPFAADVNYMRIWKREADGQWKIVLDVIGGG